MSYLDIKPYIRAKLDLAGYREWKDALNVENIPSTRLHKAYHLNISNVRGDSLNQNDYQSTANCEIKVFVKGDEDTDKTLDLALQFSEEIITLLQDPLVRNSQPAIKKVFCESFKVDSVATSNDNIMEVTLEFSFLMILNIG